MIQIVVFKHCITATETIALSWSETYVLRSLTPVGKWSSFYVGFASGGRDLLHSSSRGGNLRLFSSRDGLQGGDVRGGGTRRHPFCEESFIWREEWSAWPSDGNLLQIDHTDNLLKTALYCTKMFLSSNCCIQRQMCYIFLKKTQFQKSLTNTTF